MKDLKDKMQDSTGDYNAEANNMIRVDTWEDAVKVIDSMAPEPWAE